MPFATVCDVLALDVDAAGTALLDPAAPAHPAFLFEIGATALWAA